MPLPPHSLHLGYPCYLCRLCHFTFFNCRRFDSVNFRSHGMTHAFFRFRGFIPCVFELDGVAPAFSNCRRFTSAPFQLPRSDSSTFHRPHCYRSNVGAKSDSVSSATRRPTAFAHHTCTSLSQIFGVSVCCCAKAVSRRPSSSCHLFPPLCPSLRRLCHLTIATLAPLPPVPL